MSAPEFRHTDAGTPEPHWLLADEWDEVPRLDMTALLAGRRLVVASAHPDDETLGAGLLLAAAHDAGAEIVVWVATAGEASHPDSRTWSRDLLVETRRDELTRAVSTLAPGARVIHRDLPDSGLAAHEDRIVEDLTVLVDADTVLVAPWTHDGHTDHDTLGRAAAACAEATGASLLQYPLWLWHWGTAEDLPWSRAVALSGDTGTLARKREALACHRSQVEPLGPLPGDEPVVGTDVTTRAERLVETYLAPSRAAAQRFAAAAPPQDAAPFDRMYDGGDDPWGFADSFYESRKRALLLASLRRERYPEALEIGCADGLLTVDLATRCDRITGLDVSAQAIRRARSRGLPNATFVQAAAPDAIEGRYDLVVCSEVGYFMDPADWLATLRRSRHALAPGGELVLVHWQHPTSDIPLDGVLVHAQAATMLDLPWTAGYSDGDVMIDVYGGPVSLAEEER